MTNQPRQRPIQESALHNLVNGLSEHGGPFQFTLDAENHQSRFRTITCETHPGFTTGWGDAVHSISIDINGHDTVFTNFGIECLYGEFDDSGYINYNYSQAEHGDCALWLFGHLTRFLNGV